MKFKGTKYQLLNVGSGRIFDDQGWTLTDPEGGAPSLIRAVYENKQFTVREDLKGLYKYADWLPIHRTLRRSHAPYLLVQQRCYNRSYNTRNISKLLKHMEFE